METPGEEEPSSHDAIPHTVLHPPDGIASPTNSAEDFTQPPVDLSQASDHNTPRGTVQHHDYDHSTVPKHLAQPMDVEASFPQDMMEASVAGAVAPGYTTNSNQAPVQIHKLSKCQTNIAGTINSSNNFQIDQVLNEVHNQVHNHNPVHNEVHNHNQVHNEVHNEQHVHQPNITYNTFNTYITGDQEIPFQPVTGVKEHGALSSEDDEAVDNMVTTDSFRRALHILTTGERLLLLSAHPGCFRKSFLSVLCHHYHKDGYTVYHLSCVSDWDTKGPVERGSLVIFDCAFGDVRLDKKQYQRFYKHSLYSIDRKTTKLVFVVYPHVLLELQQYDPASDRPVLDSMEIVELAQDPCPSVKPYVDLFMRMLRDPDHKHTMGAILSLTMQGQGHFLHAPSKVTSNLKSLGLCKLYPAQLEEYASLFKGSILEYCDNGFVNRVLYDAAGLALGQSYLETVLLQVCDVKFLVQHVRTQHTVTDPSVILISQPGNGRLMIQRMVEELGRGKLSEMVQHPCLHSPEFLQELEAFCGEDQLQLVLNTNDSEHSLSLLYWSVWGPTTHLTEWCLRTMTQQQGDSDNHVSQHMVHAAFVLALINKALTTEAIGALVWFRDELAQMPRSICTEKLHLPLPPAQQRHTEELNVVCDNLSKIIKQVPLCQLDDGFIQTVNQAFVIDLVDDVIYLSLPHDGAYLSFRLLTDQQVNEQDGEGNTLLHLAAEAGHLEVIKMAVSSGASLTVKNEEGKTPPQLAKQRLDQHNYNTQYQEKWTRSMFAACKVSDVTTVKECLCYHVTVDSEDENGLTPLHIASYNCHADIASLLADLDANLNATDMSGLTPLHYACRGQCLETVQLLVERGSLVNATDHEGTTPLHTVCLKGDKDIAELLILHNAHVDAEDSDGWLPLHNVCFLGNPDTAQLLLKSGADINTTTCQGDTPLNLACLQDNTDIVRLLVANRADVNVTNHDKVTPLHCACYENNADIVRLLLNHGADVNVQNKDGVTALHTACQYADTDVVRLLLGYKDTVSLSDDEGKSPSTVLCEPLTKVDINMTDNQGRTALYWACRAGNTETARLLLQQDDIDVNAAGDNCISPLLWVCILGITDIAQLLLLHNADVNMSDSRGRTPLHFACLVNQHKIVHLLLQHGANVNISDKVGEILLVQACTRPPGHRSMRLAAQPPYEQGKESVVYCTECGTKARSQRNRAAGPAVHVSQSSLHLQCSPAAVTSTISTVRSDRDRKVVTKINPGLFEKTLNSRHAALCFLTQSACRQADHNNVCVQIEPN